MGFVFNLVFSTCYYKNTVVYTIYIDMQKHECKHVTITGIFL